MTVITRFAPSPTGMLHIGSARTALFNYLFARHHGGKYLLRIEDTDRARSTEEAVQAILDGLDWLGITHDGEAVYQFARADRHAEVARNLVTMGGAYYDYTPTEDVEALRAEARKTGQRIHYVWRDRDPSEAPEGVKPVIRLKAPLTGEIVIEDAVQGRVVVQCATLDDLILLRSDGTPTYMLSVVVDDYDMGITHIIRGDDHLTNAFRQQAIYDALGWQSPVFAHIPLIHGADGKKFSKRHGAPGAEDYRAMGILPEAMCNYLLRLGWGHGDEEIISRERAIEWFDLGGIGKAAARFDMDRLTSLNAHYIRQQEDSRLVALLLPFLESEHGLKPDALQHDRLTAAMPFLKDRAKTLKDLAREALFVIGAAPLPLDEKAQSQLDSAPEGLLAELCRKLAALEPFTSENIHDLLQDYATAHDLKLGKVAPPLRAAIFGSMASPPLFDICAILGRDEVLKRIRGRLDQEKCD